MNLFDDKGAFVRLVSDTSNFLDVTEAIVEKDFYNFYILRKIVQLDPHLIFKGGTSLSKCFKCIQRLSEDIDLSVVRRDGKKLAPTEGHMRIVNEAVLALCIDNGFGILRNPPESDDEFRPRRRFHAFYIDYVSSFQMMQKLDNIKIEISGLYPSYSNQPSIATSYITEYLSQNGNDDVIKQYDLEPFPLMVQRLEKTFIDKVFAICDYFLKGELRRNSRHIYDLHKIFPLITVDEQFRQLIREERQHRNNSNKQDKLICPSAQDKMVINDLLKHIMDNGVYADDYRTKTKALFLKNENVPYDEAIKVLSDIIDLGVF